MSERPKTTRVYVIVADADDREHRNVDLGMFFYVTDADKHVATISLQNWQNVRIEPRDLPLAEVHEAHVPCLSQVEQDAWHVLRDIATAPLHGVGRRL